MPLPNDRSRLAHALAAEVGVSLVWVYRCLKEGREPTDEAKAKVWRRVSAREARRAAKRVVDRLPGAGVVGKAALRSCPQPTTGGAL